MSAEEFNTDDAEMAPIETGAEVPAIDVGNYGGRVVENNGMFETSDGVALLEKDGELYVLEGDDVGTRVMREDEETISSGY